MVHDSLCREVPQPNSTAARVPGSVSLEALYVGYLPSVLAYVSQRVDNSVEAEEITAEVFAAAAAALPRRHGDRRGHAWLLGIARQKVWEAFRRRQRRREVLEAELTQQERETLGLLQAANLGELPEEAILHEETRQVMRWLLEQLPGAQREALLLQVVHELSIKEIAQVMGRTVGAVNSLLERARARIFREGKEYFNG